MGQVPSVAQGPTLHGLGDILDIIPSYGIQTWTVAASPAAARYVSMCIHVCVCEAKPPAFLEKVCGPCIVSSIHLQ